MLYIHGYVAGHAKQYILRCLPRGKSVIGIVADSAAMPPPLNAEAKIH